MAQGTDHADSDIDLMVVGDEDGHRLNSLLAEVEAQVKRPIHLSLYSKADWVEAQSDKLVRKILNGPKLMVIGNDPGNPT